MSGYFDYWKRYLKNELSERKENIKILGVIEDLPRDMSRPPLEGNVNKMTLSTWKGPIVQEVTDEWREAVLKGRAKKIVIIIRESITNVFYDYEGSEEVE